MNNWQPTVDVIVSAFNEEAHIDRCIENVLAQDYPRDLVRVWFVDGGSTDDTVARVREWAAKDDRLTVVADGKRRNLPEALRVGIELSSGELVAKIDAHGYPERDFLRRAVEAFEADGPGVACVGGRPEQRGDTPFGEAVALARTCRFGVGASDYAGTSVRAFVDSVQCGVYRRTPLVEVGGFDPSMNYGEDEELNWRLRLAGYRVLVDLAVRYHYVTRPSCSSAYRQYRNYGRARVRVVIKHPSFLRAHHLAPAALVSVFGALAAIAFLSPVARLLLGCLLGIYSLAAVTSAVGAVQSGGAAIRARVALCFAALHFGYGIGMIQSLVRLAIVGMGGLRARPQGQS